MMYHKNGLFFAVSAVVVLMLSIVIAPIPVSAQTDSAARVAIQSTGGEFGDVLLVKDGDDIIISGLSGAVPGPGKVTISADGMTPVTVNASFTGHFPVKSGNPVRVPNGVSLESASISFDAAGGGAGAISGTISLDITGDAVAQALRDYADEVGKVLRGEKTTIDKGMPPHILLTVTSETPTDPPVVGKVLLTQRLVIKKSGNSVSTSLVDQIEGISGAGLNPPIQSLPNFSRADLYGVPVSVDNPDQTKRVALIDTVSWVDGAFVSNGYFFPYSIPDVNSSNVEEVKKGLEGISTPRIADIFYLRVVQDLEGGGQNIFLAQFSNDITAGINGDVTVLTNNDDNAAGADASAIVQGTADPYAIVTAYAGNDVTSAWLASAAADAAGQFSISIPPTFKSVVYLGVSDSFGNTSASLLEVTTDTQLVISESPVATPQPDGTMIVAGKTEASSVIWIEGRFRSATDFVALTSGTAGDTGEYVIAGLPPMYEYSVTVTDLAGNTSTTVIPGDQAADAPSNLVASAAFPAIQVTGTAEPYSSILTFGFDAGVVPDNPVSSETLPLGAFFLGGSSLEFPERTAIAGADGSFSLIVPASVGQYIYLQAVDPAGNGSVFVPKEMVDASGNPLGTTLVTVNVTSVTNRWPGMKDTINGTVADIVTGTAVDGNADGIVVAAFADRTNDPDALIPFVDQLTDQVIVNSNGTFSLDIPDRSDETDEFITQVHVVAFALNADGTVRDIGSTLVDAADGLDRVGPTITFAPLSTDFVITEIGSEGPDMLNINRIYPAGTGAGAADLPADALDYVFILADGNGDDVIDVNTPMVPLDYKQLISAGGLVPLPGVNGLNLGVNYWDASTQSVIGNSVVFVALMDASGNYSPDPIPVFLDVTVQDPDASKIAASGTAIFANEGAVEADANVAIFENSNKTGLIATTKAYGNGGFAIVDLSIAVEKVYVFSKDSAGNESNVVEVKVTAPVQGPQYMVLDEYGIVHTPSMPIGTDATWRARAISKADDTVYALWSDGYITKISGSGSDAPAWSDLYQIESLTARDIEVVSANPFQAYVLLGNGLVLTYGDAPYFGDLGYPDTSIPRLPVEAGSSTLFLDLNGNGVRDTEDANGNGVLDISVGIGGVLETEDTGIDGISGSATNGVLDEEPLVNILQNDQGFGWDIARDLELVKDDTGAVKGYVILDGLGVLWPFGTDIGAENVRPNSTTGIVGNDQFRDLELIVQNGQIVDFMTLKGDGTIYALPSDQGGVLGAGATTDTDNAGLISSDQFGLTLFGFDIARDIEISSNDTNGDGTVDWQDGFYVLDGFGGIHASGGAAEIEDSLFLGLDIAKDLEF